MTAERTEKLRPANALLHPAWVGALVLLVANDHFLKASEFAGWWTGKLSDFAGLFVAPILFAALVGARSRRTIWLCTAAVMAVFAAINVWPEAAVFWDAGMSLIRPAQVTTVDPTDLIALPAAIASIWFFAPTMRRKLRWPRRRRLLAGAAALAGATAGIATSEPVNNGCFDCFGNPPMNAQVSILNKSHELHVLRIRYLRNEVVLDCDRVWEDPNTYLREEAFGSSERWLVQSGQEIGLVDAVRNEWGGIESQPNRECHAALVESDTVPDIVVFWDDTFTSKTFEFDPDIPKEIPADPQTVVLHGEYSNVDDEEMKPYRFRTSCGSRADQCADQEVLEEASAVPTGAEYAWESIHHRQIHFRRPLIESTEFHEPGAACQMPGPGEGLAWEGPPSGEYAVTAVQEGFDGCHELLLNREDGFGETQERTWFVCAPVDALRELEPSENGNMQIRINDIRDSGSSLEGGYHGVRIDADRRDGEDRLVESAVIYLTRGFGIPSELDINLEIALRDQCMPVADDCGEVVLPADVAIPSAGILKPGESTTFGEIVERQFHLVRSAYRPVIDRACANHGEIVTPERPTEQSAGYIEAAIVRK